MQVAVAGSPEAPPVAAFSTQGGPSDLASHGCVMPLEPSPDSLSGPPCCHLPRDPSAVHPLPLVSGSSILSGIRVMVAVVCPWQWTQLLTSRVRLKSSHSEHLCL